jgi:hypothetical protein
MRRAACCLHQLLPLVLEGQPVHLNVQAGTPGTGAHAWHTHNALHCFTRHRPLHLQAAPR